MAGAPRCRVAAPCCSRTALIYQHASRDRDEAIAAALGESLTAAKRQTERPLSGTPRAQGFLILNDPSADSIADLGILVRAGEGNRTLMTSLEGWGSAIELRPRCELAATVAYRVPGVGGAGQGAARA